jgi:hypothetical protein
VHSLSYVLDLFVGNVCRREELEGHREEKLLIVVEVVALLIVDITKLSLCIANSTELTKA